ncbi:hypothetical protein LXL04_038448 [Taraxacum kok-saghyz]
MGGMGPINNSYGIRRQNMLVQVRTIIKFENRGTNLDRYKSHWEPQEHTDGYRGCSLLVFDRKEGEAVGVRCGCSIARKERTEKEELRKAEENADPTSGLRFHLRHIRQRRRSLLWVFDRNEGEAGLLP